MLCVSVEVDIPGGEKCLDDILAELDKDGIVSAAPNADLGMQEIFVFPSKLDQAFRIAQSIASQEGGVVIDVRGGPPTGKLVFVALKGKRDSEVITHDLTSQRWEKWLVPGLRAVKFCEGPAKTLFIESDNPKGIYRVTLGASAVVSRVAYGNATSPSYNGTTGSLLYVQDGIVKILDDGATAPSSSHTNQVIQPPTGFSAALSAGWLGADECVISFESDKPGMGPSMYLVDLSAGHCYRKLGDGTLETTSPAAGVVCYRRGDDREEFWVASVSEGRLVPSGSFQAPHGFTLDPTGKFYAAINDRSYRGISICRFTDPGGWAFMPNPRQLRDFPMIQAFGWVNEN